MKNLKSQVFTIAHKIKSFFATWSQALKTAWKIAKIKAGKIQTIEFAKASTGEIRTATVDTLINSTVTKGFCRFVERTENGTQYRSFKIANLL